MESVLKQYFGFSSFRPYQKEIIEQILDGRDCMVVMATGNGKSLCYQLPPLITKKTAVVVSPLVSLMQDQVMALKQRGIKAEHLSSAQTDSSALSNAENGEFDIIYMTPEKASLLPTSFWSTLLEVGICLLAVDEAHCISEWGHDFRVEYKQLDKLRNVLLGVPVIGLTATATEKVRLDIIDSLSMRDPHISIGSFDRQNLFYGVKSFNHGLAFVNKLVEEICKYVESASSSIVYCTTVKDVEQVSNSLLKAGVKVGMYHGQMSNKAREESHRSFIRDEFYVMVATIAFGMGIDKPDIRYVIHYGCPKSLESYYQESGRCGRDGVASFCWLYFTRSDFGKAEFYCREAKSRDQREAIVKSFAAAQQYCMLSTCRRKYLLQYFGQNSADECGNCDNCTTSRKENDMSREVFLLMGCIQSCRGSWGLNMPVDVLRGSRAKKILDAQFDKLPFHGFGKEMTANWWKSLGNQLISNGYLIEKIDDVYRTLRVSPRGLQFLSSCTPDYQPPLYLRMTLEVIGTDEDEDPSGQVRELSGLEPAGFERFSQAEAQLYKVLLEERMKLARANKTAPYAVCGDQALRRITLGRPSTRARLANIDGVNQHFMKVYGDHFLENIRKSSRELDLSLDGVQETQPSPPPNLQTLKAKVPNGKKLAPAKFEAWKKWEEDGLSIERIANFPGRAAPIKEQTVLEYILEAGREGFVINWIRFSQEIGLTEDVHKWILSAISKVGKEKLKPIKNELPEEVTYSQIKACLAMLELGVTTMEDSENMNEAPAEISEPHSCEKEDNIEEEALDLSDDPTSRKRQKTDATDSETPVALEATASSILVFLENFNEGVSLSDLLKHFNGSTKESLVDLLRSLEGEFLIFRKHDAYFPM
ncbi:hypothetical protein M9H77_01064 [Catharanthus roseus]|uniref:Uncharacterized protein n=1 Tax=Catharanthus roseus TaxID=4058 RepID=A0ACC0C4H5_CATRO|nr:hypothetical protein M9H77_01064 [Catharanthus roseus]